MSIETEEELLAMTRAGHVTAEALAAMKASLRAGITTAELDAVGAAVIARHGARSAPQLFYRFPGVNLISINDEVVHGVPGKRVIRPGDLVAIDVTVELDGFVADAADTVVVPPVSPLHQRLAACAQSAFTAAIAVARAGRPINVIGRAVEHEVRRHRFAVIPELSGHGVGRHIHEEPTVHNYFDRRDTTRLERGMVITIEPIICAGRGEAYTGADGWTVRTADGSHAAHHEHTVMITDGEPVLLTAA